MIIVIEYIVTYKKVCFNQTDCTQAYITSLQYDFVWIDP